MCVSGVLAHHRRELQQQQECSRTARQSLLTGDGERLQEHNVAGHTEGEIRSIVGGLSLTVKQTQVSFGLNDIAKSSRNSAPYFNASHTFNLFIYMFS